MRGNGASKHLLLLFLLVIFLPTSYSEIQHLKIRHGNRMVIDLGAFGFLPKGRSHFSLTIYDFKLFAADGTDITDKLATQEGSGPVGFSLEERDTINQARLEQNVIYENSTCFVHWKREDRIVMVLPSAWEVPWEHAKYTIKSGLTREKPQVFDLSDKITPEAEGFLALFFFNCNPGTTFSFSVEVVEYNMWDGETKDYLSVGKTHLPLMMFCFFICHFLLLWVWIYCILTNKQHTHKIHLLMGVLVFLKALSLFFETVQLHVIAKYGHHTWAADVPYYFFLSLKGIVLFIVILLIGTGWSFLKPFLGEKDKKILIVVLPLQLIVNLALIAVETLNEGNPQWGTWRDILRILDIVCCCAILLPIVWSIRNLRESSSTDGKVARNLLRLRQFRTFYVLVVAYIYFTRIVVVLIQSALHYKVTWVAPFTYELGTLAFYFFVGFKFRPQNQNPYLSLESDDFVDDVSLRAEVERELEDKKTVEASATGGTVGDMEAGRQRGADAGAAKV
eukprot:TRINITY_DN4035_c0_g1_i1.p1 TRINITY_DN4035_c0_g1~~TRINITY_DN4035_c0_g1_i1.p1  ORF type:complete len:506 (+),score=41.05 TRINITY_DN4035_c0_g1_i1:43-1560(+)